MTMLLMQWVHWPTDYTPAQASERRSRNERGIAQELRLSRQRLVNVKQCELRATRHSEKSFRNASIGP
jgi:hypothetical protein